MSLKENISTAINSDINAQISSDAATNISEEVNSHISLKTLSLKESGEIVKVNNITYSTVNDNISMYNNFVADDYYASKSWVLSKNYLTKEDIGDIDITNNIEELLNNKADKNHDHNDLYYTKDNLDTWQTNLDLAFMDINDKLNNKADLDALYSKIDIAELDSFKSEINTTIDNFSAELSTKASIYDLDNLVNFSTFNELNSYVYESCATKDEIPTKVSELTNDNAYVTTVDLTKINELIPNAATKDNQLADKNFVNSSITTATADFCGTVESIEELNNLQGNLNDYAFYKHTDENGNTLFDRYKYTDTWEYEYTLNNSSFTSDQWEAINSGVTANIVSNIPSKISDLINDSNFATTDNIPTKTSELINDNNFITEEEAPNGVLSCKYGITTYQEIENAILAGKMPIVYVNHTSTNRRFYRYNGTYNGKHVFISVYDGMSENRSISVSSNNRWTTSSVTNFVGSASETMITNRNNKSWGISTQNYDSAVRHALCDADGSTSYNPTYTNEQKAAARNKIGAASISDIPTKTSELINDNNYTTLEDIQTAIDNIPSAGFADILEGVVGRTKVEWNSLNAGEYGSNSTYNGATLPPVMLEGTTAFWNSGSGKPLDISFHFTKKEKMTSLQVKCPPYGGNSTTMTVYYAQEGDTELTLYKEIATISIIERKSYDFNEEGISADYWVIRFTTSGWIDLRLCKPGSSFTPGLYSEVFHEQLMDKMNGYQPVGNYALKSEIPTKTSELTNDSNFITDKEVLSELCSITGYDSSKTQVLKNVNGIFKWVDE